MQLTQQQMLEMREYKNRGDTVNAVKKYGDFVTNLKKQAAIAVYDFSVNGGAIAAVNLKDLEGQDCKLPKGAVITSIMIDVVTTCTSGGAATISLGAASAADIKAATAYGTYASGIVAAIPVGTAATAIKLAADATITATIAAATVTAGKFYVLIEYYFSSTT